MPKDLILYALFGGHFYCVSSLSTLIIIHHIEGLSRFFIGVILCFN